MSSTTSEGGADPCAQLNDRGLCAVIAELAAKIRALEADRDRLSAEVGRLGDEAAILELSLRDLQERADTYAYRAGVRDGYGD